MIFCRAKLVIMLILLAVTVKLKYFNTLQDKQELMNNYKEAMAYRQMVKAADKKLQEQEEEETRIFAEAKKVLSAMI